MSEMYVHDDDFTDGWTQSDAVVVLHGFGRSGELFRGWVPHLGRQHRVLRPDLPGCGRSAIPPPDHEFSTDGLLTQVMSVIDERGLDRVHLVGEGIGGVLSTILAGRHPDRVVSLTAMTMPFYVDDAIQRSHAVGHESWQSAIETLGTRAWWLEARGAAGDLTGDAAIDGYIADEVGRTPPHVAVALSRWAVGWNFRDLLPLVQAPTLLVWAENAGFVSQTARDDMAALAPNASQWLVPGVTSQMFPFIHPDLAAPRVAAFIAEHARAAA